MEITDPTVYDVLLWFGAMVVMALSLFAPVAVVAVKTAYSGLASIAAPPKYDASMYDAEYAKNFYQHDKGGRLTRLVPLMNLSPDSFALDVGCGNGLLWEVIIDHVRRYIGIDPCSEMIAAAEKRAKKDQGKTRFFRMDAPRFKIFALPLHDVAFMMDLTEHLDEYQLAENFRAIHELLVDNGRLFIHTPNRDFWWERVKGLIPMLQIKEHINVKNDTELKAALLSAGFTKFRVVYLPHYINAFSWMHPLSELPLIGRFFRARIFMEASK